MPKSSKAVRTKNRLTAKAVENLKQPGLHADGGNLHLRVASGGTKGLIFRFTLNERIRDAGLGRYPSIGLARQFNYSAVGKGEFAGRCAIVPQVFGPNEWARLCGPRSTIAQELLGDRLEMPVRKRLV